MGQIPCSRYYRWGTETWWLASGHSVGSELNWDLNCGSWLSASLCCLPSYYALAFENWAYVQWFTLGTCDMAATTKPLSRLWKQHAVVAASASIAPDHAGDVLCGQCRSHVSYWSCGYFQCQPMPGPWVLAWEVLMSSGPYMHMLPSHVGRFQGINAANVLYNLALNALTMSPTNYHLPAQNSILQAMVLSSSNLSFMHNKGTKPPGYEPYWVGLLFIPLVCMSLLNEI